MKKRITAFALCCITLLSSCMVACNGNTPTTTDPAVTNGNGVTGDVTTETQVTDPVIPEVVYEPDPEYDNVDIHSISMVNPGSQRGSHTELTDRFYLEVDKRAAYNIGFYTTKTNLPYYIRLKQRQDGGFILLYNDEKNGLSAHCISSDDGITWGNKVTVFKNTSTRLYANPDAIVLQNGDILACVAWRIKDKYITDNSQGGIETSRSTDGGKTWSKPQVVHTGLTWEPYFLQLSSGEIQLYWTNTTRYNLPNGNNTSTGTAIIRSYDNGYTWSSDPKKPYDAQIISQQATEFYDNVQFYTDQMPVAVELLDGTIALAMESRLNRENGSCRITMAYSDDNWKTALAVDEVGPKDKKENFIKGSAPYLRQFLSGETVLAYVDRGYKVLLGDAKARNFTTSPIKFDLQSWCNIEILQDQHTVLAAGHVFTTNKKEDNSPREIQVETMRLLHAVEAIKEERTVDGSAADWKNSLDALFIGSESQAQATYRFAHDGSKLYVIIERLDNDITSNDRMGVRLSLPGAVLNNMYVSVDATGEIEAYSSVDGVKTVHDLEYAVKLFGTLDDSTEDEGFIVELAIPAELLGEEVAVYPYLMNKDGSTTLKKDAPFLSSETNNSKWIPICRTED